MFKVVFELSRRALACVSVVHNCAFFEIARNSESFLTLSLWGSGLVTLVFFNYDL